MKTPSLSTALLPLLLAAPSFAQKEFRIGLPGVGDFPAYEAVQPAFQNPDEAKRKAAVADTLAAMACDGAEAAGVQVAEFLRTSQVPVIFAKINTPSALEYEYDQDKPRVIILNENLPLTRQVLGPLLAREATKMMFESMLDTAERQYMRRSVEVRVWIELGGDPFSLPVIDGPSGYRNEETAAAYRVWLDNGSEMALELIGKQTGTDIIPVLEDGISAQIMDPATIGQVREILEKIKAMLEKDNKTFTEFLMAEHSWKKINSFRLK